MLSLPTAADALRFIHFYHTNTKEARCYVIDVLVKIAEKLYAPNRHARIDCVDRLRICNPTTMGYSEVRDTTDRAQVIHICPDAFDAGLHAHAETAGEFDLAMVLFSKTGTLPMHNAARRTGARRQTALLSEDVNGLPMAALLPWGSASRNVETWAYYIQCKPPLLFSMLQSITNILLGTNLLPNYPPV